MESNELNVSFLNTVFGIRDKSSEDESYLIEMSEINKNGVKLFICSDTWSNENEDDEDKKAELNHYIIDISKERLMSKFEETLNNTYDDIFPSDRRIVTTEDVYAFRDECNKQIAILKTHYSEIGMLDKKVFNLDGQKWMSFDEVCKVINDSEQIELDMGDKVEQSHSNFFSGQSLIEEITNCAYDNFDEHAESYINDLEVKEHASKIESIVLDYLNSNIPQPTFYMVENIKTISVSELLEMQNQASQ